MVFEDERKNWWNYTANQSSFLKGMFFVALFLFRFNLNHRQRWVNSDWSDVQTSDNPWQQTIYRYFHRTWYLRWWLNDNCVNLILQQRYTRPGKCYCRTYINVKLKVNFLLTDFLLWIHQKGCFFVYVKLCLNLRNKNSFIIFVH